MSLAVSFSKIKLVTICDLPSSEFVDIYTLVANAAHHSQIKNVLSAMKGLEVVMRHIHRLLKVCGKIQEIWSEVVWVRNWSI